MFAKLDVAPTGLLPRQGDSFVSGKKMLYPSPVSGRGSRLFTLVHLLIQVTSVVLSIALTAEAGDAMRSNSIENDMASTSFSLLFLLSAVVGILWLSASSKLPFENHGITLALLLWAFIASFALKIYAFTAATSSLSESHSARVLFMLCTLSESLGIAFVFSGFVTGLAASARPFDDTVST